MANRRQVLRAAALGAGYALTPRAFADADTDARFVLIILRGAADGLAIAPPYGDVNYTATRGELALPQPQQTGGVLKLDGLFGLHPSLSGVHEAFRQGQASIVHAIASPYRERSHFDGQDVLENGGTQVGVMRDGWLNRALAPIGGRLGDEVAIAMAQNTPLVLRGPNSVTSWAPSRLPETDDSTIARLQDLYAEDAFFSRRLAQALKSQAIAEGGSGMEMRRRRGNDAAQFRTTMQATARFLTAEDGPRIAVLDAGGWDTHANQGASTGALANRLAALDAGVSSLRQALGDVWRTTVVAVVTEFGRTVRPNGTRGTDHGTASAAMLIGGAVNGGKVRTDWPGLATADLFQGRDLRPTLDMRGLSKGILRDHLGVAEATIETSVFPDSRDATAIEGLIRS